MRTEAVLFDYGLTLVDFEYPTGCLTAALEEARAWLGADPPSAEWLLYNVLHPLEADLAGFGSEDEVDYLEFYDRAWRRAGLEVPRDTLYRILDLEQRCWDQAVRLAPGAVETIEGLRGRGLMTGICSNAPFPPEMMARQLTSIGLMARMDAVIFSSAIGRRKPSPEPYLAALQELDLKPGQVLFVGDRALEDYQGPTQLGMRAVLCTALAREPAPPGIPTISALAEVERLL
jgi:HAD superfamily hydrolase (TIGR01509 family)